MQQTDAQLTAEANVIGNETTAGANTADRVRDHLINLIDSKKNNFTTFRKTAAQWTSDNTVLGDGVKGEETDTGKFKVGPGAWNSLSYAGGSVLITNSAVALTDGAAISLTATKHTLTSVEAAITFTITYAGDDIVIELTLNATSATWTFPAGSLCVSEGVASGDNTLALAGVSGDKYIITTKKIGSVYYVVGKNFGQ